MTGWRSACEGLALRRRSRLPVPRSVMAGQPVAERRVSRPPMHRRVHGWPVRRTNRTRRKGLACVTAICRPTGHDGMETMTGWRSACEGLAPRRRSRLPVPRSVMAGQPVAQRRVSRPPMHRRVHGWPVRRTIAPGGKVSPVSRRFAGRPAMTGWRSACDGLMLRRRSCLPFPRSVMAGQPAAERRVSRPPIHRHVHGWPVRRTIAPGGTLSPASRRFAGRPALTGGDYDGMEISV
jgi:hypothetical protein